MKGNTIKSRFSLNQGFLGHFQVEKIVVKNWQKSKANPLQNWPKMAIFSKFINLQKTSKNDLK